VIADTVCSIYRDYKPAAPQNAMMVGFSFRSLCVELKEFVNQQGAGGCTQIDSPVRLEAVQFTHDFVFPVAVSRLPQYGMVVAKEVYWEVTKK
jgi:hypothetical protein